VQVEGGRIDHALHDTNAKRAIVDLLAFEKAVEVALRMTNPKETLIVVGADHSHVMTINGYPARGNPILGVYRTDAFSSSLFVAYRYSYGMPVSQHRAYVERQSHFLLYFFPIPSPSMCSTSVRHIYHIYR
jgi:alkaline phosphatase